MNNSKLPEDLTELLTESRSKILQKILATRPARQRRKIRAVSIGVAGLACFGGITAAAASGVLGTQPHPDAPKLTTTFISLGRAPAEARVVELKLSFTCAPGGRYKFGITPNTQAQGLRGSGVHCSDRSGKKVLHYDTEFDLCEFTRPGTEFFLAVSTDLDAKVHVRSKFASGSSLEKRHDPRQRAQAPDDRHSAQLSTECVDFNKPVTRTTEKPSDNPWDHPPVWPAPYFVSESGKTIGMRTIHTPDAEYPDLMPVLGTKGEKGFMEVAKPWLFLPAELEAEARRLGRTTDAKGRTFQPIYAIDGRTRIGVVRTG